MLNEYKSILLANPFTPIKLLASVFRTIFVKLLMGAVPLSWFFSVLLSSFNTFDHLILLICLSIFLTYLTLPTLESALFSNSLYHVIQSTQYFLTQVCQDLFYSINTCFLSSNSSPPLIFSITVMQKTPKPTFMLLYWCIYSPSIS